MIQVFKKKIPLMGDQELGLALPLCQTCRLVSMSSCSVFNLSTQLKLQSYQPLKYTRRVSDRMWQILCGKLWPSIIVLKTIIC